MSKCVFRNSFYLQHGIFSLCLCCKSRRKVVSIETKWSYEKAEMAACVVGRARDYVCRSLAKAMLPLEEMNFGVTVSFVCLVERRVLSPLKWPRGELRARCRKRNKASHRHSQFWGLHKVVPVVAYWMYLIHIQLGFLGLNKIDARNP